jgi:hypothetical protein
MTRSRAAMASWPRQPVFSGQVPSPRMVLRPLLCQPAMETITHWRYAPTYVNGVRVPVITTVRLAFDFRHP